MESVAIINRLLYLDRDYISSFYEAATGTSPETKITRTEGLNARASIPLLSAGASSMESRAYSVSALRMLCDTYERLQTIGHFDAEKHGIGRPSVVAWTDGHLSVGGVKVTRRTHTIRFFSGEPPTSGKDSKPKDEFVAEEKYFQVEGPNSKFALVTSADYFSSGLDAFPDLMNTVVEQVDIPIYALMRVFSARSAFGEWIATPLVMLERDC